MIRKEKYLSCVEQTGAAMRRLACNYCADLGRWLAVPFVVYYRHICELPYIPDPPEVETVSRPLYTLNARYSPRDCDDKSVLLAAWLHAHGEKCRFVATSTRPDKVLHHVFVQLENGLFVDATYKKNADFMGFYPFFRKVTYIKSLTNFF